MISIVIPTYNEADVIEQTLTRAAAALAKTGECFELIVVDDSSPDGTADISEALASKLPVRVLRRPGRHGLATAVTAGWQAAQGDVLGVMDGDLQHPPEVLAGLVQALKRDSIDLVIASRYVNGGGTTDWSWLRVIISWGATRLARLALPGVLAGIADPMSGMFLVRADALRGVLLDPVGYKILLEVLAKARYTTVVEIPYVFTRRPVGSSKLGIRQYWEYLRHVARLAGSGYRPVRAESLPANLRPTFISSATEKYIGGGRQIAP